MSTKLRPGKYDCYANLERTYYGGYTLEEWDTRLSRGDATAIEADLIAEVRRLRPALERARVILDNMARENKPAIAFGWQRWPIHHEPLRSDARNALPQIEAALAGKDKP